mmetsp:Transcript_6217/g.8087  ORF Transcript_6217/g.8087 Transcript_6217/m.8087 type:complete len:466 (-) Transcript_6217:107-1504(-)
MKISNVGILAVLANTASAFAPAHYNGPRSTTSLHMSDSLDLANQLVKANEEKAAAVSAAEAKNQAEIEDLKLQIAQIEKLFSPPVTSVAPSSASTPAVTSVATPAYSPNVMEAGAQQLSGLENSLATLFQNSNANTREYNALVGSQGPSLSDVISTSVVAGTFGGLVTSALDGNRRDSIGGIMAGVAGAAVSLMSPENEKRVATAKPVFADPRGASVTRKVLQAFPGAQTNAELVKKVSDALTRFGYGQNTLLATSFCCDEVNRPLEDELAKVYGNPFIMGGLAGFPFGGVTSFGAMAKHIPDGGSCLVVYGPHVGLDYDGKVGVVPRRGKEKSGTCCGSGVAAASYVDAVYKGELKAVDSPTQNIDAQQLYVGSVLLPYAERLAKAADSMIELPYAMFEPVDDLTSKIIDKAASKVGGDGKIALLGGIQINTPNGVSDYFLPLRFEIRDNTNKAVENLLVEKRF